MLITIFTPTYNRRHLLGNLFDSLCQQTKIDFEWIIVDDGSSDGTEELIMSFLENKLAFTLTYVKQQNAGKHIAINNGVKIAKGELFFIVDSDDFLPNFAIEKIIEQWGNVKSMTNFIGVVGNKCLKNGQTVGNPAYQTLDCSPTDFRFRYKEKGDKAEVIKTSIFLENPFPTTANEKFCPEAIFFNRLTDYKLRYFNDNIYYCEYLEDGLSANSIKIRKESPINTSLCYREMTNLNISFDEKMKAAVNFYRFARYTKIKMTAPFKSFLLNTLAKVGAELMSIRD